MATIPITVRRILVGNANLPPMKRFAEKASSSALMGVPVLMTSGVVDESPTINDGTRWELPVMKRFTHPTSINSAATAPTFAR